MAPICSSWTPSGEIPQRRGRIPATYCCHWRYLGKGIRARTKASVQWMAPPWITTSKKVCYEPSKVKVMLIVAYDGEGVIISHAVPLGQNVNAAYYQHFLEHNLHPAMQRKCPHVLRDNPPCVLQDNARHVAGAVSNLLLVQRWYWKVLKHPPYSPDMSPCDYDLFPRLKEPLRTPGFKIFHQCFVQ
jgi:hypothetical protein